MELLKFELKNLQEENIIMSNKLVHLLSEVVSYFKTVVFSMKKAYLNEFQGDIG